MRGPLWRNHEFLKLWFGNSVSATGSQVTVLAVPLAAVLLFHAGPAETGLLTALGIAPMLLFSLIAGVWIDRLPRRPIRIIADLLSALVVVSIPVAAFLGDLTIQHLYAATFLAGCCAVWTRLSVSAMLPSVVGRENLLEANTKMILGFSVAQVAGPSLAGILVQLLSAPLAMLADAASFVISAVSIWRVRLDEHGQPAHARKSIWHEVVEGVAWLRGEPVVLRLTLCIGLANLAWYGVQAIVVVYGTRDLGLSPAELGLALGAVGPATLVGAIVAAYFTTRFGLGPTLIGALAGEAVSRVILLVAGGPPALAGAAVALSYVVFGFIGPLWDVNANSLRQSATPPQLLGRVTAASTMVGVGMAPVGALLAGWIGEVAGTRAALVETTLVTMLAVAILVRSPVSKLRDTQTYLAESAAQAGQLVG